jgi:GNAT superfamily N-acetyltransferase
MSLADIPVGMRLKEEAGWNQREADWQRLIELQPGGGFVAELDGVPVGTVTTCRFGPVAWVAMMLVDEQFRSMGIGRALLVEALKWLDSQAVASVRLDATPLGRPLYESLGFRVETTFARYAGTLPPTKRVPGPTSVHYPDELERLCALDRRVTGTDRSRLLQRLALEYPQSLQVIADEVGVTGFLMSRLGSEARQIGPCIASAEAGARLFEEAGQRYAGEPVFIDIPETNQPAAQQALAMGLSVGRTLTRMGLGPRVVEDFDRLWASAGPEKG